MGSSVAQKTPKRPCRIPTDSTHATVSVYEYKYKLKCLYGENSKTGSVKVPVKFFGRSAAVKVTFTPKKYFYGAPKMALGGRKSDFSASNFRRYKHLSLYMYLYLKLHESKSRVSQGTRNPQVLDYLLFYGLAHRFMGGPLGHVLLTTRSRGQEGQRPGR